MQPLSRAETELLERAREAAKAAYCPYSRFPVGAAVETEIGVFVGCNVENASYGLAICAERVALFTATAAGARRVISLAVSCAQPDPNDSPESRMPCGACRQVMAEFMPPESMIVIDGVGARRLAELLPQAFQLAERPFLNPPAERETEPESR